MFQCHQTDRGARASRVCAGWAGCHEADDLLAVGVASLQGLIDEGCVQAVVRYVSPVPLFGSGCEAADHGQRDIVAPGDAAAEVIAKVTRRRGDLLEFEFESPA